MKRYTLEDVRKIAEIKGGKYLSNIYINYRNKNSWECKFGHKFDMSLESVNMGYWCQICSGNKKLTIEDAQNLAESKRGL